MNSDFSYDKFINSQPVPVKKNYNLNTYLELRFIESTFSSYPYSPYKPPVKRVLPKSSDFSCWYSSRGSAIAELSRTGLVVSGIAPYR